MEGARVRTLAARAAGAGGARPGCHGGAGCCENFLHVVGSHHERYFPFGRPVKSAHNGCMTRRPATPGQPRHPTGAGAARGTRPGARRPGRPRGRRGGRRLDGRGVGRPAPLVGRAVAGRRRTSSPGWSPRTSRTRCWRRTAAGRCARSAAAAIRTPSRSSRSWAPTRSGCATRRGCGSRRWARWGPPVGRTDTEGPARARPEVTWRATEPRPPDGEGRRADAGPLGRAVRRPCHWPYPAAVPDGRTGAADRTGTAGFTRRPVARAARGRPGGPSTAARARGRPAGSWAVV